MQINKQILLINELIRKKIYFSYCIINYNIKCLVFVLFIILLNCQVTSISLASDFQASDNKTDVTPTEKFNSKSTIIRIDTLINGEDIIPSSLNSNEAVQFTPEQDSAYFRALRANVTTGIRIWNDLQFSKYIWYEYSRAIKKSDVAIAMESLTSLPKEFLMPDPKEVVQREINIANSFYVPYVSTYNPQRAVATFEEIGKFFGVVEDVSPEITYRIEKQTYVEVVVYSISAVVIAKIFEGNQPSGIYKFTWNGRDDKGVKMPKGDYVAEIRIGNEKYIRKRIAIN